MIYHHNESNIERGRHPSLLTVLGAQLGGEERRDTASMVLNKSSRVDLQLRTFIILHIHTADMRSWSTLS